MRSAARFAVLALAALHLAVLCAGFVAPYGYATQHRDRPLSPPSRIRFTDEHGRWHLRPRVAWEDATGVRSCGLRFFVPGAEYTIAGLKSRLHLFGVDEPARVFLLGTDAYGRDQFSRLVFGGQMSLLAGSVGAAFSLLLGVSLGGIAGLAGRWADAFVMRAAELFLALPWLYLLLGIRAFLPLHVPPRTAFLLLAGVLGLIGWAVPARLVRGLVLSLKERGFVLAARGFGGSGFYVLRRHILPHTAGLIATQAALLAPKYILAEVTMSFLGLGLSEPVPSWGNMLAGVQQVHILTSCWWMLAPAVALVPVVLAFLLISRGLLRNCGSETM